MNKITQREYYKKNKKKLDLYNSEWRKNHYRNNEEFRKKSIERVQRWRREHPEKYKDKLRDSYIKRQKKLSKERATERKLVLSTYSGGVPHCVCCGEKEIEFLTLDHIYNNGNKERRDPRIKANIYKWVIKNNFPKDMQVLCWNCNVGKYRNKGICPHKAVTPYSD